MLFYFSLYCLIFGLTFGGLSALVEYVKEHTYIAKKPEDIKEVESCLFLASLFWPISLPCLFGFIIISFFISGGK